MSQAITHTVDRGNEAVRRIRFSDCLKEVTQGVGPSWKNYQVIGATRNGLAPAKEAVGKSPERYKLVEPGSIFYNPMRILIGSIAFVDEGEKPGITSPDYVVFKSRPGVVHPRWLYYWLRSDHGAAFIKTLARGAVRERMLFRRLATAEILLPRYEAQIEFATQVLAVEKARAAGEGQLEAAKALPAAYLRAVFSSAEAQRWQMKRLEDLSSNEDSFSDGPFGSNLKTEHYVSSGARVIRLQNIGRGTFLDADKAFISLDHYRALLRHSVKPGDVIVAALGNGIRPAGRACIVPRDFGAGLVKADCFRVRLSDEIIFAPFLMAYLNAPQSLGRVADMIRGATRPRFTLGMLRQVRLALPPLAEQRRIAARIRDQMASAERTRKALEDQLATINKLPAALLRRASSGEL